LQVGAAPRPLGELVDRGALADGRVFVDGVRETRTERVPNAGAIIDVYVAREADEPVRILAEHEALIAVYKPAPIATEPDRQGARQSLLHEAARLLAVEPAELHALSRLDVGVSGVVLLARKRGRRGPVESERCYVAISESEPAPPSGEWSSAIDGKTARTHYRTIGRARSGAALLVLEPETGRMHQLRIHCERAGAPLFGDPAHGGRRRIVQGDGSVAEAVGIALHALAVRVEGWHVVAPPPPRLTELWQVVGGNQSDWEQALAKW
jgi:23S rRNA-/tRNA-specific pseudouridylate synthase